MILKRIIATVLDILIAFIPVSIVGNYLNSTLNSIFLQSIFFYWLHTSILLVVTKQYTFGEKLVRIRVKHLKCDKPSVKTLVFRNLFFGFYLILIALSLGNKFEFVLVLMLFLSLNVFIFFKNKNNKPMTAIDFVFKTYYENV
ncbi:MAG: hypothetical protein D6707_08680 [Bacteroidetes bacterium]|nr:MAG: hypothetical protein D6707_08680 [Bacteroidota bacterium]